MNVSTNTEIRISENVKLSGARNVIVVPHNYNERGTKAWRIPGVVKVTRLRSGGWADYSVRSIGKDGAGPTRHVLGGALIIIDGVEMTVHEFFTKNFKGTLLPL